MFIDFTSLAIQIDHERFPTGLIVHILAAPESGYGGVFGNFGRANPKMDELWPVRDIPCQRLTYSLTEQRDHVAIEDENYTDFQVQSYYIDDENVLRTRSFTVTTIEREGWTVEIEETLRGESMTPFVLRLPRFDPRAVIDLGDLGPPQPPEKPEEKPAGKPIWERLEEDQ
jgi:hypothetical protein